MAIALAGGAVVGVLSLLLGFAARRAVTRPARQNPATGYPPAGHPLSGMPAAGTAETSLPLRWPALALTLLRPDLFAVALAVWLALLDVVLCSPRRGRSRSWSTTRSGTSPSRPGWLRWPDCTRCPSR